MVNPEIVSKLSSLKLSGHNTKSTTLSSIEIYYYLGGNPTAGIDTVNLVAKMAREIISGADTTGLNFNDFMRKALKEPIKATANFDAKPRTKIHIDSISSLSAAIDQLSPEQTKLLNRIVDFTYPDRRPNPNF